ncbi:MAG TPA: Crp/Fnr family transcriptional regulator [Anaerovoracaceae bacterium]|nr:Crp/Fnr family transcriptional regulator [Anaerovoracaceae bacterium]
MNRRIDLIKNNILLSALPEESMQSNLENGVFRIVSYEKNSIVHFDGETCDRLEVILTGNVVVDRIDESGNLLTISEFHSGDILGGNLLFSGEPNYPMTVSTKEVTELLAVEKEDLFQLLCDNPLFLRRFLEHISDRATILGDKIKHYLNKTIRESMMNYLTHESKRQNSNKVILEISKKELSERIGVQRTSLSRELAKMRKDGLIKFDRSSITLL